MTIVPTRHPLLHHVRQGARWVGQDAYPSCVEVADEHERWLEFVDGKARPGSQVRALVRPPSQTTRAMSLLVDLDAVAREHLLSGELQ